MTFKTWFTHKQQKWSLLWWLSSCFPQWNKAGKADSEVPFQKCLGINYSHHILHFPFLLSKTTTLDLLFWSPHSDKLLNFILFPYSRRRQLLKMPLLATQNIRSLKILLFFNQEALHLLWSAAQKSEQNSNPYYDLPLWLRNWKYFNEKSYLKY